VCNVWNDNNDNDNDNEMINISNEILMNKWY